MKRHTIFTLVEGEATAINKTHKPFKSRLHRGDMGYTHQIGNGFYTINSPDSWLGMLSTSDQWYCVIEANIQKFDEAAKLWIPESFEKRGFLGRSSQMDLWSQDEDVILDYIKSEMNMPKPEKVLRFSYIAYAGDRLHMLIPTKVVNDDGLGLWSICFETKAELLNYSDEIVDWKSWNIAGNIGEPSYPLNGINPLNGVGS
ncbi:uncharacterized protein L3040_001045 [Drepanopeziza brunnea f. sp. 'multigermtubi']|uniref:uncharacterized protein n=1 Tax=Drepanopeziza brunnea f. sp. 'multigermtubi' TaxID=698441 RepID=UPI002392688F|nr:hypothetical protein L3040_001045 [Drepanopeziza brunnea f. sp. 'multigermtubi']